jgi:hypothetical protein
MSADEQIAKLTKDLQNMQKLAQDHHNASQQALGAAGYIQGQLIELQAAKAKAEAPSAP